MSAATVEPSPSLDRGLVAGSVLVCAALSIAALAVPATLAYDPWAWLVWGREVAHLDLDTTQGPSWKPLPVLLTPLLAPFGSLAPALWLVVARTLGLLALVAAYRVARQLAGRAAGVLAAGLLLLTPDNGPRFVRLVLEGHSAPITAGLALWAVDRHLAGRHRTAFALLVALALDRPEAWPFLAGSGLWLAARDPGARVLVTAGWAAVPLLWFGGDWWGAGSPLHGADAAQVSVGEGDRTRLALERAGNAVVLPAVIAAGVAAVDAWRRRDRTLLALLGCALGWSALVVAMSAVLGYAALARFFLPAAGLLCVVVAVAVVRLLDRVPAGGWRMVAVAALAVVSGPAVVARASNVGALLDEVEERARADADLAGLLDSVEAERLAGCGTLSIDSADVPRPALAWRAEVALSDVRASGRRPTTGSHVVRSGGSAERRLLALDPPAHRLGASGQWVAYVVACPAADSPDG